METVKEVVFRKVSGEYGWLSNMSPHKVQGFKTAEALFQSLRFDDLDVIDKIRACNSPMAAKMCAKKYVDKMVVGPRGLKDRINMKFTLMCKVEENPDLKTALLALGPCVIIEDVTARPNESGLFWGMKKTDAGWEGQNQLGKMWMDLHNSLMWKTFASSCWECGSIEPRVDKFLCVPCYEKSKAAI